MSAAANTLEVSTGSVKPTDPLRVLRMSQSEARALLRLVTAHNVALEQHVSMAEGPTGDLEDGLLVLAGDA